MLIKKEETLLVVVDVQEKLMPIIKMSDELSDSMVKMITGAKILNVPILVTQQYTRGLGDTTQPIKEALGDFEPIEKTAFGCCAEPAFMEALEKSGKKTVVLIGIETHICVQQTALALIEKGYNVVLLADCLGSRSNNDKKYGIRRMSESGAVVTTCESLLFELLGDAKADSFRAISKLVK